MGAAIVSTVLAEIYGPDLGGIDRLAHTVADEFRQTWDMAEVWASVPYEVPEYRFRVRSDKAAPWPGSCRRRWMPPWDACSAARR